MKTKVKVLLKWRNSINFMPLAISKANNSIQSSLPNGKIGWIGLAAAFAALCGIWRKEWNGVLQWSKGKGERSQSTLFIKSNWKFEFDWRSLIERSEPRSSSLFSLFSLFFINTNHQSILLIWWIGLLIEKKRKRRKEKESCSSAKQTLHFFSFVKKRMKFACFPFQRQRWFAHLIIHQLISFHSSIVSFFIELILLL